MDIFTAIKERRSVRQYSQEPVSEEQKAAILEAGRWAPSRGNTQGWKFIVIEDAGTRRELSEIIPTGKCLGNAMLGIAVVINPQISKHPEQDAAAATQNMLLAAYASGLGSCWISVYGTNWAGAAAKVLQVPDEEWLISIISLGYPAEHTETPRKPLSEITFINRYG